MKTKKRIFSWLGLFLGMLLLSFNALAEPSGERMFKKRCAQCHDLPSPDKLSSTQWEKQLGIMAPYAGLSGKQKSEVLDFLQSHSKQATTIVSMAREKKNFEKKCGLCHTPDRIFYEKLTPKSRRHIVLRMQKRAMGWISPKEAERILAYLDQGAPGIDKPVRKKINGDAADLFRERCTGCHTLERIYLELEEHKQLAGKSAAWMHIVKRMREKAPDWIDKKEAEQIARFLKTLRPVKEK